MKVTMTSRHLNLNESLKEVIQNRIAKIENQFEILSRADVILTQEAHQFHVHLKVDGAKYHFHATAADYDLLRAVDTAIRRVRDQADKSHKKTTEYFKHHLSQQEVLEHLGAIP